MTNFNLKHLPERTTKPRKFGLNMVMDKGLSLQEIEGLLDVAGHLIDFVKLGFGTAVVTQKLPEKIQLYKSAGIKVYFGGTLFEAYLIRGQINEFIKLLEKFELDTVEISDGSMDFDHNAKCKYISTFAKNFTVLSEVGSKRPEIIIKPAEWVKQMLLELEAGSSYVIAEAREAGNIGIYNHSGAAKKTLISKISEKVPFEKIIWEAPQKSQQVYFIKEFGANVNLGNIPPSEVIPLETLRLGLRGDTFFQFLPDELKNFYKEFDI
ncbi:MAG: phosphosulfolactate synthase [Bacteroidales bacterium]|nr:phosphosulfolactate synthase [Bacteroidales bacterium]